LPFSIDFDCRPFNTLALPCECVIPAANVNTGFNELQRVQHLATSNAQILYALKILRAHGMCKMAIQAVFRSVILARLLYPSPAWWGFAGAQDRQKVYRFLRRSARVGFCSSYSSSFDDLCIQDDQNLFNSLT